MTNTSKPAKELTVGSYDPTSNALTSDVKNQTLLQWLAPIDPKPTLEKSISTRYPGTGQWFLEGEPLAKWLGGNIDGIDRQDRRLMAQYHNPESSRDNGCSVI
jgi:hypothetical protein